MTAFATGFLHGRDRNYFISLSHALAISHKLSLGSVVISGYPLSRIVSAMFYPDVLLMLIAMVDYEIPLVLMTPDISSLLIEQHNP